MKNNKLRREIPIAIGASFFAGLIGASLPADARLAAGAMVFGGLIIAASL